ncbi:MAG: hypothetical protein IPJ22_15715 [Bacteroidetes bacterium]|nr:hypothetical protein [Bacteroidota bacterium]
MGQLTNIADIKALYPDEWVLLGNPIMDESEIDKSGQVFLVSIVKTKRSLLYR